MTSYGLSRRVRAGEGFPGCQKTRFPIYSTTNGEKAVDVAKQRA